MSLREFIDREIERCDREIAQMQAQEPIRPAYLTTIGILDWESEKRILQRLAATSEVGR